MSKKLLIAAALLAGSTMVQAADLPAAPPPAVKVPPPAPVFSWTGFYIGAHGGYAFGAGDNDNLRGGFGGGQIGVNWQAPGSPLVLGVEVDAAGGSIGDSQTILGITASTDTNVFGTARGRLGAAFDQVLVYGTGGLVLARNELSATFAGLRIADTQTHFGWTAGGGVEVAFGYNWSIKAEYLYARLGSENYFGTIIPGGLPSGDIEYHLVNSGINYRFGGPLTARY